MVPGSAIIISVQMALYCEFPLRHFLEQPSLETPSLKVSAGTASRPSLIAPQSAKLGRKERLEAPHRRQFCRQIYSDLNRTNCKILITVWRETVCESIIKRACCLPLQRYPGSWLPIFAQKSHLAHLSPRRPAPPKPEDDFLLVPHVPPLPFDRSVANQTTSSESRHVTGSAKPFALNVCPFTFLAQLANNKTRIG